MINKDRLFLALKEDNAFILNACIENGLDVNTNYNDVALVTQAVFLNSVDCLKALIDAGADINVQCDTNGWTPLCYAIIREYDEFIKLLIEAGASLEIKDQEERTPLLLAIDFVKSGCMDTLIECSTQASLNICDADGFTPLMLAIYSDQFECMKKLISAGCDVTIKNNDHETALMLAERLNKNEAYDYLVALSERQRIASSLEINDVENDDVGLNI